MIPVKPPPLLPCFDASIPGPGLAQDTFRELFEYLYVDCHWYVTLPKGEAVEVRFRPRHFRHALFKEPATGEGRTLWVAERAERILWIGYTLEHPTEVRQVGAGRFTFFTRMADHCYPWFLAVTDQINGELDFVTAYPLDHNGYLRARRTGVTVLRR